MRRHALITLGIIMCLTIGVDYAAVRPENPQDRVRRDGQGSVGETTIVPYPQFRKPVDNSPTKQAKKTHTPLSPEYVQSKARIWFLQREHLDEWLCIDQIIYRESRWIPNLHNAQGSTAYGLGQVKGSHKYTANKPMKQFKVAVKYAIHKYGTMCKALEHHNLKGWY